MSGGPPAPQTSTTVQSIPDELKPLANLYVKQATSIAETPFQAYGGQRFADLSQDQTSAMNRVRARALGGDPTMDQANQTLQQTLQGGQTNPYLDALVNKAQSSVAQNYNTMIKPQTESAMVNSGSFGNAGLMQMQGLQQQAAADKMGDIATSMYGSAYDQDRARQMQALNLAPTYGEQTYRDAGQLMNVGNIQQAQRQKGLDFNYDQFQAQQNDPYKKLQATGGVINSGSGQVTTSTGGGDK